MLIINNLSISASEKKIVSNLSLTINDGEIHVLMGPNGSGKSTLSLALAGQSSYTINPSSKVSLNGIDLLPLTVSERAQQGLFLSFQQPVSIPGLSVQQLIKVMMDHLHPESPMPVTVLRAEMEKQCDLLHIKPEFLERSVHDTLSGGEQKRLEMLQLLMAKPKVAILDEIDSGLDVDAIKVIATAVEYARTTFHTSFLIITHYRSIIDHIKPDHVHILTKGQLMQSGGNELIDIIEKNGYQQFK